MNIGQHLQSRGLQLSLYPHASLTEDVAIFPMYNFGKKMTGFNQYRPGAPKKGIDNHPKLGKYYSFVVKNEIAVFGMESWDFTEPVYLTGGMFKAATLNRLGYTSLHVSAVNPVVLRQQLELTGRPYFAIGDADAEGAQFIRRFGGWQSRVDLDEMTDDDVHTMLYYETALLRPTL